MTTAALPTRICETCHTNAARAKRRKCAACQAAAERQRARPFTTRGYYCRCGCGEEAMWSGLAVRCYKREQYRKKIGQWTYLDRAFSLDELDPIEPPAPPPEWSQDWVRPTPYHGPELAECGPPDVFGQRMIEAIVQSEYIGISC